MRLADLISRVALHYAADRERNIELPKDVPFCLCVYVNTLEPKMSAITAIDESKSATFAEMVAAIAEDMQFPSESPKSIN